MVLTLAVYWYLFSVKRAALLRTISTWSARFSVNESHTELAYSSGGLIKDLYTFSFVAGEPILKLCRRKFKVPFAILVTVLTVLSFSSHSELSLLSTLLISHVPGAARVIYMHSESVFACNHLCFQ